MDSGIFEYFNSTFICETVFLSLIFHFNPWLIKASCFVLEIFTWFIFNNYDVASIHAFSWDYLRCWFEKLAYCSSKSNWWIFGKLFKIILWWNSRIPHYLAYFSKIANLPHLCILSNGVATLQETRHNQDSGSKECTNKFLDIIQITKT